MVSTKQGNRRRGNRQSNARRFKGGGGGSMNGIGGGFNLRAGMSAMFSVSQIPDNPGYVDFNEPTVPVMQPTPAKHKSVKNERYNRRGGNHKGRNQAAKSWSGGGRIPGQTATLPPLPPPGNRNFRNAPIPRMGGRPMPLPPMAMRPHIPPPMPPLNAGRFGPRPLIPPPLTGVPMPPPLMPPRGPPMRGAPIPPRPIMPRRAPGGPGPIRRNKNIQNNRKNEGKGNRRRGPNRSGQKSKKTTIKKTLSEIVNQYPLDKPWVTDDIKEEHRKKEEIENKLKGNRDDKLFAEFKIQRDKFVNLYEAARLEYIGKHPEEDIEKIMTESDKAKADAKNANENANVKVNENDTNVNNVGVVSNVNFNVNKVNNDTPSSKADTNVEVEMANINDDAKQKAVEKPKQQAVITNETPKAVTKPRPTRTRGKNVAK